MPRYFLHLRDGVDQSIDEDGIVRDSLAELRQEMLKAARDIISHDARNGTIDLTPRIDAEDQHGSVVLNLPLADAVTIIGPAVRW